MKSKVRLKKVLLILAWVFSITFFVHVCLYVIDSEKENIESSEKLVFDHSISFEIVVGEKFPVETLALDVNDYVFQGYLDGKVVIAERGNRGRSESLYFSLKEKDVITLSGYVSDNDRYDIEVVRLDEDSNKIELSMSKYVVKED